MQNKVSVIIPVYNVEQYLEKCLDSVVNQTYKNLEIICVNDCSPDNSSEILDEYKKSDARIKILKHTENGGLSASRNTGLDNADGEYIYFLDSDDWIDKNYIEQMVTAIQKSDTDIVLNANIIAEYPNKKEKYIWYKYQKELPEGEFVEKQVAVNDTHCMAWCHLYKKNFLDKYNLRFLYNNFSSDIRKYIHEDSLFQHVSKTKLDKIFVFFGPKYHYRQTENSIMAKLKGSAITTIKTFIEVFKFYDSTKTDTNGIKLISPIAICHFYNEDEFNAAKELFSYVNDNLKKNMYLYNDYERYIIDKINTANSYEEYRKITNNNIKVKFLKEKLMGNTRK